MKQTPEQIEQVVKSLLAEQAGVAVETLAPETLIVQDLQCDSLHHVEIAMGIERELDIKLPDDTLLFTEETTVGELVESVQQLSSN